MWVKCIHEKENITNLRKLYLAANVLLGTSVIYSENENLEYQANYPNMIYAFCAYKTFGWEVYLTESNEIEYLDGYI